jgi:uncharacterized protein (DUF2267 family)
MQATETKIFGNTLQKTDIWLKDLMDELNWQDRYKAYQALKAVLQALRDRLTVEEVAQLGAQLPMLVRGFYYEGWNPTNKPVKERHKEAFCRHVGSHFRDDAAINPEEIVRAVFYVLSRHVTEGEIEDVKRVLPSELQTLWS